MGLLTAPAEKIGGYSLSQDNPAIFQYKKAVVAQDRAFPREQYPAKQAQAGPSTSSGTGAQSQLQGPTPQSKEMLIKMHRELARMAQIMGVPDLCTLDKASSPENLLEGITSKNLTCKYCKKTLSTVTHLKNHYKAMHFKKTAHKCQLCNKYFSESSTLRRQYAYP